MGFTSAEPAHFLEILQSIALLKVEEVCNKNFIWLKNMKIKSVVH